MTYCLPSWYQMGCFFHNYKTFVFSAPLATWGIYSDLGAPGLFAVFRKLSSVCSSSMNSHTWKALSVKKFLSVPFFRGKIRTFASLPAWLIHLCRFLGGLGKMSLHIAVC